MMKIPAIVPNNNEGVESGEDDNIEPHPKFESGIIYESIYARDARLEADKNGLPIVEGAKYSLYPKMSRSRRETLTDLLDAGKVVNADTSIEMATPIVVDEVKSEV